MLSFYIGLIISVSYRLRLLNMIRVKHPLDHCNRTQEETIKQLPEDQRRFQELFYSYANGHLPLPPESR